MTNSADSTAAAIAPKGRETAAIWASVALSFSAVFAACSAAANTDYFYSYSAFWSGAADIVLLAGFVFGKSPFVLLRFKAFAFAGFLAYVKYCGLDCSSCASSLAVSVVDWSFVFQIALGILSFNPHRHIAAVAGVIAVMAIIKPALFSILALFGCS